MIKRDAAGFISFGKWELCIQALIILSLIAFAVETLPGLSPLWLKVLHLFEIVSVLIFTVELALRTAFCQPRGKYLLSFMGVVDFVAILPFYLALGLDLRSARALRLLRLFRIFKLTGYHRAMNRYREAFRSIKEELILFGFTALIFLYLASVGIYYFENPEQPEVFSSVFTSMWWAVVTLTSVGYGDIYPITTGGRIFTGLTLMVGLGVVAVPTGLFASALSRVKDR